MTGRWPAPYGSKGSQDRVEGKSAARLVFHWGGGALDGSMMALLHRVLCCGDHVRDVHHLARRIEMQVVEEG